MAALPLDGIRVTDFSWIINGPQIAQWLAVMGAEVIKVESQSSLDNTRYYPAGFADRVEGINRNGYFHQLAYGKKSVSLNLRTDKGHELAEGLIKRSDLVIECYPAPVAEKLGITYERIRQLRPDIVMLSVSLLGKTGLEPARWSGWGPVASSFVGAFDAQGYPGGAPRQTGGTWPDYAIAGAVVFHILAALRHRQRTGEGQWIDAGMGDTVIGQMYEWFMDYFMNGRDRHQRGNRDDVMAPHNTYPCQGDDRWIAIAVGDDDEWRALCSTMGNPSWTREAKYADQFGRFKHSAELDRHLAEWTKGHEHIALAAVLQKAGVAAGPVLDGAEIFDDPQLWEWGYWWRMKHREAGERVMPGVPVKLSNVPEFNRSLPPDLGQHNREILGGLLGLSDQEIAALIDQKVVY